MFSVCLRAGCAPGGGAKILSANFCELTRMNAARSANAFIRPPHSSVGIIFHTIPTPINPQSYRPNAMYACPLMPWLSVAAVGLCSNPVVPARGWGRCRGLPSVNRSLTAV
jgi:uncharacterized membrane protein